MARHGEENHDKGTFCCFLKGCWHADSIIFSVSRCSLILVRSLVCVVLFFYIMEVFLLSLA